MLSESLRVKLRWFCVPFNLVTLFLLVLGSVIISGVGWIVWYDVTSWDKGMSLIFFGSRTGEAISLGIGVKVIHYFIVGSVSLLTGLLMFIRRRRVMCRHKMSEGVVVTIPKTMVDEIRKRSWFKYYSDIGDFILSAIKGSVESWEKFEQNSESNH